MTKLFFLAVCGTGFSEHISERGASLQNEYYQNSNQKNAI